MIDETAILNIELFAWLGEDELGSGQIGLKQRLVPAGLVPMVAISKDKIDRPQIEGALARQSQRYGKPIYLVRFYATEIIKIATDGEN